MDDLAAHRRTRAIRALALNAAELIRHPAASETDRHNAEQLVHLARTGHIDIADAHQRISAARNHIRDVA